MMPFETNVTDLDAIGLRRSRRKYLSTPMTQRTVDYFKNEITKFNQDSGLSIFLLEDGSQAFNGITKSYGMLKGVRSLIVLKGASSDAHLKEKCGYYGERLVLDATKLGLGTCWVAGTYNRKDPVFKCDDDEEVICVITIGHVEEEKSMGEQLIYKLTHRKTKPASEFYSLHHFDEKAPEWFLRGIESVMKAPSAVNSQPVHFVFDKLKHQITAHVSGKRPTDLIDLGIAKLHFEIVTGGTFALGNGGNFYHENYKNDFS